jgi:hypothetical protein
MASAAGEAVHERSPLVVASHRFEDAAEHERARHDGDDRDAHGYGHQQPQATDALASREVEEHAEVEPPQHACRLG